MKNRQTITVISDKDNPEPLEVIADSIIKVADAFDKIANGRLTQRAVVLLIKDMHKDLQIADIEKVLDAVPRIAKVYLKSVK